jgi:hypothetical protein
MASPRSFYDSELFQSFEQHALNKGMVKPQEPTVKQAAPQIDLSASDNLSENLLKLCQALRAQNLHAEASEIEQNFLMLKQAEVHLYRVFDEDGADIVEFAHPEGSPKLDKDWSDLGEVETITDRQKKIKQVVEKQPKGTLDAKMAAALIRIKNAQQPNETDEPVGATLSTRHKEAISIVRAALNPLIHAVNTAIGNTALHQSSVWEQTEWGLKKSLEFGTGAMPGAMPGEKYHEQSLNVFKKYALGFLDQLTHLRNTFYASPDTTALGDLVSLVEDFSGHIANRGSFQGLGVQLEDNLAEPILLAATEAKDQLQRTISVIQGDEAGASPAAKPLPQALHTEKPAAASSADLLARVMKLQGLLLSKPAIWTDPRFKDWAAKANQTLLDYQQRLAKGDVKPTDEAEIANSEKNIQVAVGKV